MNIYLIGALTGYPSGYRLPSHVQLSPSMQDQINFKKTDSVLALASDIVYDQVTEEKLFWPLSFVNTQA